MRLAKGVFDMNELKRMLAGLVAVTAMLSISVGCSSSDSSGASSGDSAEEETEAETYKGTDDVEVDLSILEGEKSSEDDEDASGNGGEAATEAAPAKAEPDPEMEITWLADYNINPEGSQDRSVALTLFEDYYGGKVNYVQTNSEEKFDRLASMILSGDPVDMFPYEWDAVPNGVMKNQYEPLDPYFDVLGMDTELWEDMEDVIDMFSYNDQHYVIPYMISDPLLITYSRKMMQEEGLEDPYELYQNGEWDWDAFMEMMDKYVANAPSGTTRYGINGWFGQAIIQSTGHTVVNYEDGVFVNNISDPEIEKAELLMQEIAKKQLYRPEWIGYFPDDHTTLFFAMADWALGTSNARNEGMDLMIVPFPKSPSADDYYLCCNYGAKMLVKNSKKGKGVATYIKCERLAATEESFQDAAREKALIVDKTASGLVRSYLTEEQYDALVTYRDPSNVVPMFDFGYGMGERMYGDGEYTYETRGVMNNLTTALLEGSEAVDSWATLRDAWTGVVSEEIARFNK